MKTIVISVKELSGAVGLIICYTLSIYFFWNSQTSFHDFRIDPENSHFTRLLHSIFGYGNRQGEPNRTIGVIFAFISIHVSWSCRYFIGARVEKFLRKTIKNKSTETPVNPAPYTQIDITPADDVKHIEQDK